MSRAERIETRTLRALLGGCGVLAIACSGDPESPPGRGLRASSLNAADSIDAIAPSDVRVADGVVWVVDKASERLVALDSSLRWVRSFGREGSGPGELRGALRVRVRDSVLIVSEIGNGRMSAFSTAGRFLGAVRMPNAAGSFDLDSRGRILSVQRSESHYLTRVGIDGAREDVASRDPELSKRQPRGSDGRLRFLGADLVTVLPGDSVVVLDNLSAELIIFGPDGRWVRSRKLDADLSRRLMSYRNDRVSAIERTRRQVWSAPLVKDMWLVGPRTIALLSPVPGSELMFQPLDEGPPTSVELRDDVGRSMLRSAIAAAMLHDQLIIVGDSGVTRHLRLEERIP